MAIVTEIGEWSLLAFGTLLLLVLLIAHEVGYWIGLRHKARSDSRSESAAIVVGGILGLLAFVLALTLSFASSRFNERREGTLIEANAIGTAWLQAAVRNLGARGGHGAGASWTGVDVVGVVHQRRIRCWHG
jgi:Zn-dependent protease with chaperone function